MFVFTHSFWLYGQENKLSDVDELFRTARNKAFEKNYEASRKLLEEIMTREPRYLDVRVFYARTFAWEKKFDIARDQIKTVLAEDPDFKEGLQASIDVEFWSGNFETALVIVNKVLSDHPNDEDVLLRKAQIQNSFGRFEDSLETLVILLTQNPANSEASALAKSIKSNHLKNSIAFFYGVDVFSQTFDPAHYSAIQFGRITNLGPGLIRLNHSYRFGQNGFQPEVDLYPRITKNIYLYANYGYSSGNLFPAHRAGVEGNFKLPRNFEISAGFKLLDFQSSRVWIYTGSAGVYFGNYWVSWRPYLIQSGSVTTFSSSLTMRRYFKDADNYAGLLLAAGFSPDDRRIQSSAGFSQDGIFRLASQRGGLMLQKTLTHNWSFNVGFYLVRQELSFDQGKYVWISNGTVSLKRRF